MAMQKVKSNMITTDLIAQHILTDDEYMKIVEILECKLIRIRMDS